MYLIVGLGNPGKKYQATRHNVGFQVIDQIISKFNISSIGIKFNAETYKGVIHNKQVLLVKPQTFMNDSGKSIAQFYTFYKIEPKNIIVIYDDLDMAVGKLRVRSGGSDGGHNGIKSINQFIKNEYIKLKIGIGHPGNKELVTKYVLRPFDKNEEIDIMAKLYNDIVDNIDMVLDGNAHQLSGKINNKQD